ncbi:MAG: TraC family protein [Patescibacteria group bacterium]|nr:TraC family protein [Patescibacteria group bacterium]
MWLLTKSKDKVSSRGQIRIKEVKDGILILPDNRYRIAIETSSVNFELKSDSEQDVLIESFQSFLNSLPCPIQVLIRVREVDIERYLEQMSKAEDSETEKVYKAQVKNYCAFIKNLVSGSKILSRRFYLIVSYDHFEKQNDFELIKEQLRLRQDLIVKGLENLGMKAKVLDSLEILELFYSFYNPNRSKIQELKSQAYVSLMESVGG